MGVRSLRTPTTAWKYKTGAGQSSGNPGRLAVFVNIRRVGWGTTSVLDDAY